MYPFLLHIYEGRKLSYRGDWWHLEIVSSHPLNYCAWVTWKYYSSSLSGTVLARAYTVRKWFWRCLWERNGSEDDLYQYTKHLGWTSQQGRSCWLYFRIPIPKHAFQITSERSCAEVLHLLQHQQAASSPKFRSVTLCCCISPFLFSPWTSLPLHTLVGKKNSQGTQLILKVS